MEIHRSARKHGVSDAAILHALDLEEMLTFGGVVVDRLDDVAGWLHEMA